MADNKTPETRCPYCGSLNVIDCGEIFSDGTHHFECPDCKCAHIAKIDGTQP